MTETATIPRTPCLCGCGEIPGLDKRGKPNSWLRGHASRGVGGYREPPALPSPADLDGDLSPEEWAALAASGSAQWAEPDGQPYAEGPAGPRPVEDIPPEAWGDSEAYSDPPPAHGSEAWGRLAPEPGPIRVTAAIRRDIKAKVSIPLAVGAAIFEARDPVCGGRFQEQRKAIADDLTDIFCDSPQIVAFMTSRAGGYMKYFKLIWDLWPVGEAALSHHILHREPEADESKPPGPDMFATARRDPARYPA